MGVYLEFNLKFEGKVGYVYSVDFRGGLSWVSDLKVTMVGSYS
jgi:hypothetical protein